MEASTIELPTHLIQIIIMEVKGQEYMETTTTISPLQISIEIPKIQQLQILKKKYKKKRKKKNRKNNKQRNHSKKVQLNLLNQVQSLFQNNNKLINKPQIQSIMRLKIIRTFQMMIFQAGPLLQQRLITITFKIIQTLSTKQLQLLLKTTLMQKILDLSLISQPQPTKHKIIMFKIIFNLIKLIKIMLKITSPLIHKTKTSINRI